MILYVPHFEKFEIKTLNQYIYYLNSLIEIEIFFELNKPISLLLEWIELAKDNKVFDFYSFREDVNFYDEYSKISNGSDYTKFIINFATENHPMKIERIQNNTYLLAASRAAYNLVLLSHFEVEFENLWLENEVDNMTESELQKTLELILKDESSKYSSIEKIMGASSFEMYLTSVQIDNIPDKRWGMKYILNLPSGRSIGKSDYPPFWPKFRGDIYLAFTNKQSIFKLYDFMNRDRLSRYNLREYNEKVKRNFIVRDSGLLNEIKTNYFKSNFYIPNIITNELINEIFEDEDVYNQIRIKMIENIVTRKGTFLSYQYNILFPDVAQYYTILETDKILVENGMTNYGLFEVTRSNNPQVNGGTWFYSFDDQDNLLMMLAPYQVISSDESMYAVFDAKLYEDSKVVCIPKNEIISFKLYGTELMQSTVSTNTRPNEVTEWDSQPLENYQRPSITGTIFSSFLFGSTYTLLNGVGKALHNHTNVLGNKLDSLGGKLDQVVEAINNISITTDHKIIDTSRVQIVLTNRRDLEINGINIFYDLNRVYPHLDKPSNESVPKLEEKASSGTNLADEVLKLKQLLDQGIIDEEEFKAMKKKLIN